MNGGSSDDQFEYFLYWVISRGKAVYDEAMINPDSLISQKEFDDDGFYDFELFSYIPQEAFENKTGNDFYEYIAEHQLDLDVTEPAEPDDIWDEDDISFLKNTCPNLFNEFYIDAWFNKRIPILIDCKVVIYLTSQH